MFILAMEMFIVDFILRNKLLLFSTLVALNLWWIFELLQTHSARFWSSVGHKSKTRPHVGGSEEDYSLLSHTKYSFTDIKRYWLSVCFGNLSSGKKETLIYLLTLTKCEPSFTLGQPISHAHATKLGPGAVHAIDCGGCCGWGRDP